MTERIDELIEEYSDLDDKVVGVIGKRSETIEDFEVGLNQERVKQRAAPAIAEAELRLEAKYQEMVEDYGEVAPPANREPEEVEPDFDKWKPSEGTPWSRVIDEYNSGNLDGRLFEKLQEAHATETDEKPMRA